MSTDEPAHSRTHGASFGVGSADRTRFAKQYRDEMETSAAPRPFGARLWITRDAKDSMQWVTLATTVIVVAGAICLALGRIPVNLPMPTHAIGMVTPTCGLTRGTIAIARGDFMLAFRYNPMSYLVVPFVGFGLARIAAASRYHNWFNVHLRLGRASWIVAGCAFVALWAYQQSHAMFIMHNHTL